MIDSQFPPIKPVGNHFIAEVLEDSKHELRLENGMFILPKNLHTKPMRAKVIMISDDFDNNGLSLSIGDEILLPKYGSIQVTFGTDMKKYQLCNRLDIIGII